MKPRWWWVFCQWLGFILGLVLWRLRIDGVERLPREGGMLLAANHQSYMDPVFVGLRLNQEMHFMARQSLFRNPLFGGLIRLLNAFEVNRDSADLKAVRHAIGLLRGGKILLVFPEGTRTRNGKIGELKAGISLLAGRADVPVVPVLIDGAFEAWPKGRFFPGLGSIRVTFGEPIWLEPGLDVEKKVRDELLDLKGERNGCRIASS